MGCPVLKLESFSGASWTSFPWPFWGSGLLREGMFPVTKFRSYGLWQSALDISYQWHCKPRYNSRNWGYLGPWNAATHELHCIRNIRDKVEPQCRKTWPNHWHLYYFGRICLCSRGTCTRKPRSILSGRFVLVVWDADEDDGALVWPSGHAESLLVNHKCNQ